MGEQLLGQTSIAPPPSPGLRIRTMEADLQSIGVLSGIGSKLEIKANIPFSPLSAFPTATPSFSKKSNDESSGWLSTKFIVVGLVIGFILMAVLAGYFFIWPRLMSIQESAVQSTGTENQ